MHNKFTLFFQITRRYAEYSAAILGISENFPHELVNMLLAELQDEVGLFILRMAAIFPQRKEQLIFLINNYDMILGVLTVSNSMEDRRSLGDLNAYPKAALPNCAISQNLTSIFSENV